MNDEQGRLEDGELVNDQYEVLYLVGLGELGEVYEVTDRLAGQDAVLKLFIPQVLDKPDVWQSYQDYCARVRVQGHATLVTPREFAVHPSTASPFAIVDKVPVPALDQLVATVGNLLPAHFARILKALAPVLDNLHNAGFVHRNLKPSNIFCALQDPNSVKLTDFEISQVRSQVPPYPGWGATPGWVAPEGVDPHAPNTPAMDVYALGLVGYFAMTGRLPYLQLDPFDPHTFVRELSQEIPSASERAQQLGVRLDPKLDSWFARTLAVSPEARFPSVTEMADALMQVTQVGSPLAVAPTAPAMPSTPPSVQTAPLSTDPGVAAASVQPLVFNADLASRPAPAPVTVAMQPTPVAAAPARAKSSSKIGLVLGLTLGLVTLSAAAGALLYLTFETDLYHKASKPKTTVPDLSVSSTLAATAASEQPPAASAEPAPTTGHVEFHCKPKPCTSVECDDHEVDAGDAIELDPGQHVCKVSAEGFEEKVAFVTIQAGKSLRRDVVLDEKKAEEKPADEPKVSPTPSKPATKATSKAAQPKQTTTRPKTTPKKKASTPAPKRKTKPCGTFIPCK